MWGIDCKFNKEDLMKKSIERFKNATDIETITLHMTKPVELERIVFYEDYLTLQKQYGISLIKDFKEQLQRALARIDEFIVDIRNGFGDLKDVDSPITEQQLNDLYQYLYGEIFKNEVDNKQLKHLCAKRNEVKAHQFFENDYEWCEKSPISLFTLPEFKTTGYTEAMMTDDINLLQKPIELTNLIVFFKMLQFVPNNADAEVLKLTRQGTDKFINEIKDLQS